MTLREVRKWQHIIEGGIPRDTEELTMAVKLHLSEHTGDDSMLRSAIGTEIDRFYGRIPVPSHNMKVDIIGALMIAMLDWRRDHPDNQLFAENAVREEIARFHREIYKKERSA